ncbi:helix-turn-helix transcriptional regulator [Streptomyces sp. SP17BM10]|uniref:helix-turn-helix domain-containing protein n=1 Tax=Streptomyces sp. SP17BM10 TaxID=3002530 RepID=UPI002E78961D|nr:helix-turn-helix transcriptional regulator [Streptomyces sp. SP17BM10]MEE1781466.1 helix-turn-helix transcriptional regulator [Streptomyces sp. SP17BM10]
MSDSAVSSVQQARQALGLRLREIRKEANLTARALARLTGWHESKCSRIENGRMTPSPTDIRTWTVHCGVPHETEDLLAVARGIDGAYVEWRRLERPGLRRAQEAVLPLFERTRRFRMYQSWVVPGILQTPAYTRAVLETIVALRGVPDDVTEAVAVRMDRQKVLHVSQRRFAVLVEEWVLRTVIGSPEITVAQLGHLIAVAATPSVSLGIIPLGRVRGGGWPVESFTIYDEAQVNVELVSAHLTVTRPGEIHEYARAFVELSDLAVYGAQARALITSAIDAFG